MCSGDTRSIRLRIAPTLRGQPPVFRLVEFRHHVRVVWEGLRDSRRHTPPYRWLELDPHDTEVIDRLAALRFAEQRYEEAYRLYRTLAEITPDSAQTHSNLGATLYYLGRSEDALRSFERALSLDPDLEPARAGVRALTPD